MLCKTKKKPNSLFQKQTIYSWSWNVAKVWYFHFHHFCALGAIPLRGMSYVFHAILRTFVKFPRRETYHIVRLSNPKMTAHKTNKSKQLALKDMIVMRNPTLISARDIHSSRKMFPFGE
jgi:hypothetical protein